MQELTIGLENTETYTVEGGGTAPHLSVPVLATPSMIGMIEHCCMMITQPYMDEGEVTVGAHVCVSHLAPTYVGETYNVRAVLTEINGRRLTFEIEADNERGPISRGTHRARRRRLLEVRVSDATRAVAAELRAIVALLATRELDDDTLTVSRAHLDAIRATLDNLPVRPRWYEVDASDRDASRAYHDEFGPLRGAASVVAPPLIFSEKQAGDGEVVVARARCGAVYEGPPRLVHGGIVAACFDEMLAVAQRDAGVNGLTAELTVRYRGPITIDTDLTFTAWIESDDGRRAVGRAACVADGELAADATATFIRPKAATEGS